MKKLHILLLFSILLISCNDNSRGDYDLLITNANIVDVKNNQVIRNQMIGIKDDTIAYTGPMSGRDNYDSSETLDAQGKFLFLGCGTCTFISAAESNLQKKTRIS